METIKKIVIESKKKLYKDHDCLFVIVGPEGSGKSHLMMNILDIYNPNSKISDISMNAKDFVRSLRHMKRYGNPVFDEAGDGLYSREAMGGFNRLLNKTYMAIRGLNLFTILVLPDFFDLDSYFRKHRVKGLFQVYKRGSVKFWNKRQIEYINIYCDKTRQITQKPSVYDTFPIYKGHLAEQYKELKLQKIKETLNNLDGNLDPIANLPAKTQISYLLKLNLTPLEITKLNKFDRTYVYEIARKLKQEA